MKAVILKFRLKLYTLSVSLILLSSSFTINDNEPKKRSADWQLFYSNAQIDVRYRYSECNLANGSNNENVYLQIINKTENPINVEWNTEYWYNGKCNGCESGNMENHKSVSLKPMETKEGTCSENCENPLKIFSKMLGSGTRSELTDFNLKNIEIKIAN
jgi:uncharacterized protein YcfL